MNKLIAVLILSACFSLIGKAEGISIQVIAQNEYESGRPVVVNVRLINSGSDDCLLVYAQDGSLHKFRYPYLYFNIVRNDSVPVPIMQPIDKVVNPLSSSAFFTLKSGAETDLLEDGLDLSRHYDLKEGKYSVSCVYSTAAEKESQWYGSFSDDYWSEIYENSFWLKRKSDMEKSAQFLARVQKITIMSEPVFFTIGKGVFISKDQALEIARKVCIEEKWRWDSSKAGVFDEGSEWKVVTNSMSLGMNGIIRIDKRTGEVVYKFMTGP